MGHRVLTADCGNCFGLCCVVPSFAASADFAIDKPAETPCPNLLADSRCGIHTQLRERGFRGCTVYDCFGAGQQVSQVTFEGQDWRTTPSSMFSVFPIMRQLHELLWYLRAAQDMPVPAVLAARLESEYAELERRTDQGPDDLLTLDVAAVRAGVAGLLREVSAAVRGVAGAGRRPPRDLGNADLIGADLRKADLRGADLRGALLIGARLTGADLRGADLIGADLRGAKLGGADLREALFLTQAQLDAARGDRRTRLPEPLRRPAAWERAPSARSGAERA